MSRPSKTLVLLSAALLLPAACARRANRSVVQAGEPTGPAAEAAMTGDSVTDVAMRHMRLTPARAATAADSARARALVAELRRAIAPYRDTSLATRDGYRPFLPNLRGQRVLHFTSWRRGAGEAFRWDPAKPTSLLYRREHDGRLTLLGAMYTAPRRTDEAALDARVPLGIARWHTHVNWCVPRRGEERRWRELRDGAPVFGPRSPIATRAECDAVGGRFHAAVFGWMVHVEAFAGDDLATIFGGEHGSSGEHRHQH